MENITSADELKNAIQLLEAEQANQGQLLKEHFYITYESLKPLNIIKGALKDISSSPNLVDNILGTAMGLASGYLSKRAFIGASGNLFRKLIGTFLQVGVTSAVAQRPEAIKSVGQFIIQYFLRKKEKNFENRER